MVRVWQYMIFCAALSAPGTVFADSPPNFQRDPTCLHIATVQFLNCEVSTIYSCRGKDGHASPAYREEISRQNGPHGYSIVTENGAPILSADVEGRVVIEADPTTLIETPFKDVLDAGAGSFLSKGSIRVFGVEKPINMKVVLNASGTTEAISGLAAIVFDADVSIEMPPPMGIVLSKQKAYLMNGLGIYINGETVGGITFKSEETPHRPLSISLPGQPGFDSNIPINCPSISLNFTDEKADHS